MDNLGSWKVFETTGKVADYLKYTDEKRVNEARESFISMIEGEKCNGRKNHGDGNGHFRDAYR